MAGWSSSQGKGQKGVVRPQLIACDIGAYELIVRVLTSPPYPNGD